MLRLSFKTHPQAPTGAVEEGQAAAAASVVGEGVIEGSAILSAS